MIEVGKGGKNWLQYKLDVDTIWGSWLLCGENLGKDK